MDDKALRDLIKNALDDFRVSIERDFENRLKPNRIIEVLNNRWVTLTATIIFLTLITSVFGYNVSQTVNSLRAEMRAEMNGLRSEMRAEMNSVRSEMNSLRAEMKAEMSSLRANVREDVREALKGIRLHKTSANRGSNNVSVVRNIASEDK